MARLADAQNEPIGHRMADGEPVGQYRPVPQLFCLAVGAEPEQYQPASHGPVGAERPCVPQ
jgi:hypothetical protein